MVSGFAERYRDCVVATASDLDWARVDELVARIVQVRERSGRLFILGLGGSAGNAGHLVNDLRKLAGVEAYAPTDNVSELTARINDDGWGNAFAGWLKASRLTEVDAVLVLSVGGGDLDRNVSPEIVRSVNYAKSRGADVFGIVGRDGGHTAALGDVVVTVPTVDDSLVTPLAEAFQAVIWHGIVSHPDLAVARAHWETITAR